MFDLNLRIVLIISYIICISNALANANSNLSRDIEKNKKIFEQYKGQIAEQDYRLLKIKASLQTLEQNLGSRNQILVKNLEQIKKIENEMQFIQDNIKNNKENLDNILNKMKTTLNSYVVHSISGVQGPSSLASSKILIKTFQNQIQQMQNQIKLQAVFQERLVSYEKNFKELSSIDKSIREALINLENQKRNLADAYMEVLDSKNNTTANLDGLRYKLKKNTEKVVSTDVDSNLIPVGNDDLRFGKLGAPLSSYLSLNYENKGVTFKFNQVTPIKSVGKGKVIYSGNLASYGNVIMIDHGDELRSLILGSMTPRIEKGTQVNIGDILGYTKMANNSGDSTLYFEIRKKNVAQNTFLWFDKSVVALNL